MKKLFVTCLLVCGGLAQTAQAAGDPATPPTTGNVLTGVIQEIKDVDSYTYIRILTKDGETWAAVSRAPLKVGATVSIGDAMVMQNFESKTLKKTFPSIVFGTLAGSNKPAAGSHGGATPVADTTPIKVEKAKGANAYTVAEVISKGATLKDKTVLVRGKVVKFNPAIMDRNWVHLRDGSGSEADGSNDILVTTKAQAKVGDVITLSGTVRVHKDFGAGYTYKVLIEDGAIQP